MDGENSIIFLQPLRIETALGVQNNNKARDVSETVSYTNSSCPHNSLISEILFSCPFHTSGKEAWRGEEPAQGHTADE